MRYVRRPSYQVFPLRGRCHGVTDEVELGDRSVKTAIENSFHHLIRRYTPPSPQGEGKGGAASGKVMCCAFAQRDVSLREVMCLPPEWRQT